MEILGNLQLTHEKKSVFRTTRTNIANSARSGPRAPPWELRISDPVKLRKPRTSGYSEPLDHSRAEKSNR